MASSSSACTCDEAPLPFLLWLNDLEPENPDVPLDLPPDRVPVTELNVFLTACLIASGV